MGRRINSPSFITSEFPLFTRTYLNTKEQMLTDDAALSYNGYVDGKLVLNIRPGESLAKDTGKRNDGLFAWTEEGFMISVDEGEVTLYRVEGNFLNPIYAIDSVSFTDGNPVTFAQTENYVFMAGGGKINYVNSLGEVNEITDVDAPTFVTHVAFLDGYILAVDGTKYFRWSDIPTNTDWSALSFASAEGNPDAILSLKIVQRQIYLLGTNSTEIWENDGVSPFSRIPGGLIEIGCIAKYSPIKRENTLMWLSHNRKFVEFTGTQIRYVSSRYDEEISKLACVSDCIGNLIVKDGKEHCVFQFPSENRTLVYTPEVDDWNEWGRWNSELNQWESYDIRSAARDVETGQVVIGKRYAGCLTFSDSESSKDFTSGSSSEFFRFLRRTGFIDNGTDQEKILRELAFRVTRGSRDSLESPIMTLRYRDNGSNDWSNEIEIDMGEIGDTEHFVNLFQLGSYRSRQFEFSVGANIPLSFTRARGIVTLIR